MSVIRKHGKKWQVMIRRNDSPHITKSFLHKEAAQEWARETEVNIEKGLYSNVSQIANLGKDKKPQKAKKKKSNTFLNSTDLDKLIVKDPYANVKDEDVEMKPTS